MNPMVILSGLKSAIMYIIGKTLSEKFFVWLILWIAEAGVKSTKNTRDDKFYAKIKEAVDAPDD